MKFNKQIIIILVLLSLLLSAVGGAYYFYMQNQKTIKISNQVRVVYVAKQTIKKGSKVSKKDLKEQKIARKYITVTPLLKKEIIGRYAKENIYKDDVFRKEKLAKHLDIPKKIVKKDNFKYNSYNMKFSMFQNPNYSIKKDDIIKIISVYKGARKKSNNSPNSVQYIADQIRVIEFLINGKVSNSAIKKVTITKTVKRKKVKQTIEKKASELVLDINSKVLLHLIDDYNRGKQLWMVKTHKIKPKPTKAVKKENVIEKRKKKKTLKRSYPFRLYKPKNKISSISATIHYGDEKDAAVTKSKSIKIDMVKQCKNSDKYLLGISNNIHLRRGQSFEYKIMRTIHRNYLIPYIEQKNNSWYKTCDGLYVHKNEVKTLTYDQAQRRLAKIK